MYKLEDEPIELASKLLPKKKRVKINTLKVTRLGYKVGELFIKLSVGYAQENKASEIYLTHYTKEQDSLVSLIQEYGLQMSRDLTLAVRRFFLRRFSLDKKRLTLLARQSSLNSSGHPFTMEIE